MGDIIEIDNGAQFLGFDEFLDGGVVGAHVNVGSGKTHPFRKNQLRQGTAVHAAAFFFKDLHQMGIGRGFHREIFLKGGETGKGVDKTPRVSANGLLIVNIKGRGVFFRQFGKKFIAERKCFFHLFFSGLL